MTTTTKMMLLAVCLGYGTIGMAQEQESERWRPDMGLELTTELQVNHHGDYNHVNLLRLNATLPVAKGVELQVASISTCLTEEIGIGSDLQVFSNIEAWNIPFALSLCNINWQINDSHALSLGIRSMNEDYFVSPVTSFFTNSSCGVYPTVSANYPIANYPLASIGMHYRYDSGKAIAVQASLYNGEGAYRFTGSENIFRFCPQSDGIFGLAQIEYRHGRGSWYLGGAAHYGDILCEGRRKLGSTLWAYTEQRVTDKLSLIAAYSHAFDALLCTDFAGVGGCYTWKRCEFGIFTDYARILDMNEFATELSCKIGITPHLHLQPTVHIISTDGDFQSVAMLRLGVNI